MAEVFQQRFSGKERDDMGIVVNLDVMMARRKKGLTELAGEVDLTLANLSILKNNKAKAVRFTTLDAICKALDCQPGDILEYVEDAEPEDGKPQGGAGEDRVPGEKKNGSGPGEGNFREEEVSKDP